MVTSFADTTGFKQLEILGRENEECLKVLLSRDDPEMRR
jgi:hypothetical protein